MLFRFFANIGSLSIYIVAFLLGGLTSWSLIDTHLISPLSPKSTDIVPFEVIQGDNLKTIAHRLEEKNFIKNWLSIYGLGRLRDKNNDQLIHIAVGEYKISAAETPSQILQKLLSGEVAHYNFTIPEGTRISDLPAIVAKSGLLTAEEFFQSLNDRNLRIFLNVPSTSFEGYLFPDTYQFTRPIKAEDVIKKMYLTTQSHLTEEFNSRASELGYTIHQILTLASIIEKETAAANERVLISSVFHNRLAIGMPLQSDPTVIYGIPNFNGNLTKQDLNSPSVYNTYLNTGLPPTPICNPGLESIKAALYPDETEFLYFVAKGDGTHQFSKSYKEHQAAVAQYQKKKKYPAQEN